MKIIAINGSHRGRNGYTQHLIDKFFDGSVKAGAECETIVLAEKKINQCKGCHVCQLKSHYLRCIYDGKEDDVAELFEQIRNADKLVFATPIYVFSMTGLMKKFLERMAGTADSSIRTVSESGLLFHHIDRRLFSKPFVLITCQDNMEDETNRNVVHYFKTFSRFLDAPMAGALTRKSAGMIGRRKELAKDQRFLGTEPIFSAYTEAGEEFVRKNKLSAGVIKRANQNFMKIPGFIRFLLGINLMRRNPSFMGKILANSLN